MHACDSVTHLYNASPQPYMPHATCHAQAVEVSSQYDGCKMAGQSGTLADNDARQQFLWDVSVGGTTGHGFSVGPWGVMSQ